MSKCVLLLLAMLSVNIALANHGHAHGHGHHHHHGGDASGEVCQQNLSCSKLHKNRLC